MSIILFLGLLDFILIGGILPLIERKFLSLVQRRVGPYYIGYKGRLQFLADAIKVFMKDFIYHGKINSVIYLTLPVFFLYVNSFLFLFFVFEKKFFMVDINHYFIYVYIIIILSNILVYFTGVYSKNKYAILSSNRAAVFVFSLDLLLTLLLTILISFSESFSIVGLKSLRAFGLINIFFLPLLPLIVLVFLMDANKAPYDMFEAESELVMGYTTEYSGFLFGLYILTEYLHAAYFA